MKSSQHGFSLIELLIAVALLAIIATLAAPSFVDYIDRSRVRGAADGVASLIALARTEAVRTGQNITVASTGSAGAWCVGARQATTPAIGQPYDIATNASCDCSATPPTACVVSGQQRVFAAAEATGVTLGSALTAFTVDGKLGSLTDLSATPAIQLVSPRGSYTVSVQVSALGQARACTPSDKPAIPGVPTCA